MELKLYNTLTRQEEVFEPLQEKEVRMYSCGPTVYKDATIGNMRTNIFMDTLRRVLKYNGYTLKHVMNITDVGHLVSDADEGEDKMVKSAKEEGKTPLEIAQFYTQRFMKDLQDLEIDMPEIISKATDHIEEMIAFVKGLVEKGYAYETTTAVYFDVSKLEEYGVLSGIKLEEQKAGARVELDEEKRNPYDFALWIKAPENHVMKWNSPWGLCYPGWHIECSAMGKKYLGEQFDIHTGGIDLIPTHHENEIAQSKGLTGKNPARFWIHGEFLLINGGKMSKSLGNVYLLSDIVQKGYSPLVYKMFCFSASYRNKLNFTWEAIESANKALIKLKEAYQKQKEKDEEIAQEVIEDFEKRFHEAINDDLNMPLAMSVVWEVAKYPTKSRKIATLLEKFDTVLGINITETIEEDKEEIPEEIQRLVEKRKQARIEKKWELSDQLRDEISEKGYLVKDSKEEMIVEKK